MVSVMTFRRAGVLGKICPRDLRLIWLLALGLMIPLGDSRAWHAQAEYDHAYRVFIHGDHAMSQREAEQGVRHFQGIDAIWADKFMRLVVDSMLWRGLEGDAEKMISLYHPARGDVEATVWKLTKEGYIFWNRGDLPAAEQRLNQAGELCRDADYRVCGDLLKARGELAATQGQREEATAYLLQGLSFARASHDRWMEATVLAIAGWNSMIGARWDESMEWFNASYRVAVELGAQDLAISVSGDLIAVLDEMGDWDRALAQFQEVEKLFPSRVRTEHEFILLQNIGFIAAEKGDLVRADAFFKQSLNEARRGGNPFYVAASYWYLCDLAIDRGNLQDAKRYFEQAEQLEKMNPTYSRYVVPLRGRLASMSGQYRDAEFILRQYKDNTTKYNTERLLAGMELAHLLESEGRDRDAEEVYKSDVHLFEESRGQIRRDDLRFSLMTRAMPLYSGYIDLLVLEGKIEDALEVADSSRARTLARGLAIRPDADSTGHATLRPGQIAQRTGATLLFYWLGKKHSYLWAIQPRKTSFFRLPPEAVIADRVARYRAEILQKQDPFQPGSPSHKDGRELFDLLVAPAAKLLKSNEKVMILADGALSQLSFDSLLAPGPSAQEKADRALALKAAAKRTGIKEPPAAGAVFTAQVQNKLRTGETQHDHYWIEDVILSSASSLSLLAASPPRSESNGRLFLVGDAVPPNEDFPSLALAQMEMNLVGSHFGADKKTIFSGPKASPSAYLTSSPEQYAYLHFVTHGTASTTAPLESAIILSRDRRAGEPSVPGQFKLYARDILQHPLNARLVTISACYGSGTRSYSGEGLVGLAWAFLRAGAHNVIGALWEVTDESSPRLMDKLYVGISQGLDPTAALRNAKLSILHGNERTRAPFYWAAFDLYTGH